MSTSISPGELAQRVHSLAERARVYAEQHGVTPVTPGRPWPFAAAWFLDVDGVLNVIGPSPRGDDSWPSYGHTHVGSEFSYALRFCYAPALMDLLNLLVDSGLVSVRWLTTWEYDAPKRVAPALGLKLGGWVAGEDMGRNEPPGWWKLRVWNQFRAYEPERFVIWSDDEINDHIEARQVTDWLPPEVGLVLVTDERTGLTPSDMLRVISALERHIGALL